MARIDVNLGERSFSVHVKRGSAADVARFLPAGFKTTRVFVVTDEHVAPHYAGPVVESFERAGLAASLCKIPPGEAEKNLARLEALYHQMVAAGLDRRSLVVALGGGVVGDIAGFAAATYMRGIAVMQVPTTIVAQVDSSIGGKTAVDLPEGKNLVGAFHQPVAVVADPGTLRTLPEREVRAGLAEVIKHGVIRDAAYFEMLEAQGPKFSDMAVLLDSEGSLAEEVIARSVEIKAEVVSLDEREGGLRAVLNFGHTVAHALETVTGYEKYLHGEAVAVGMVAATNIARLTGLLDPESARRITALIEAVGLPTAAEGASAAEVTSALARDKKALSGAPRFVLPREIGSVEIVDSVPASALREALVRTGFA